MQIYFFLSSYKILYPKNIALYYFLFSWGSKRIIILDLAKYQVSNEPLNFRSEVLNHTIEKSTLEDLPEIFKRYKAAAAFQRSKKNVVVWPSFDPALVEKEFLEGRQ